MRIVFVISLFFLSLNLSAQDSANSAQNITERRFYLGDSTPLPALEYKKGTSLFLGAGLIIVQTFLTTTEERPTNASFVIGLGIML